MTQQEPYKPIYGTELTPTHAAEVTTEFGDANRVRVLNAAGPRLSKAPQAHSYTFETIKLLLSHGS
jgi:hypothetical protein